MHLKQCNSTAVVQQDNLITLISVVRENQSEQDKLLEILNLDSLHRKMAVNFLVMKMRQENAPEEFVAAWDSLQDDNVAERARALIQDGTLEARSTRWSLALIFGAGALLALGMGVAGYFLIR